MGDYQDLRVWREAHALVLRVYDATRLMPPDERFGFTAQLRRSAVSIPSNLVEGVGRNTDAELVRFVGIALGSANELQYLLFAARELGLLDARDAEHQCAKVRRMLARLAGRLRRRAIRHGVDTSP